MSTLSKRFHNIVKDLLQISQLLLVM